MTPEATERHMIPIRTERRILRLLEKPGLTLTAIGRRCGVNRKTVRTISLYGCLRPRGQGKRIRQYRGNTVQERAQAALSDSKRVYLETDDWLGLELSTDEFRRLVQIQDGWERKTERDRRVQVSPDAMAFAVTYPFPNDSESEDGEVIL